VQQSTPPWSIHFILTISKWRLGEKNVGEHYINWGLKRFVCVNNEAMVSLQCLFYWKNLIHCSTLDRICDCNYTLCRSQWPRGLWPLACCDLWFESERRHVVCVVCCDELIIRPEKSYRLWRVVVCDKETSCDEKAVIARTGLNSQRWWWW
jgi:hypothetical protein